MKIKIDKFSFEFTVKDIDWFNKLNKKDQITFLVLLGGAAYFLNKEAMKWYTTIKEENRKDKMQNSELKATAKKIEVKNSSK